MPYGTVNLLNGVPEGETTVTCTASVGTFILEFAMLTHLTGKHHKYEPAFHSSCHYYFTKFGTEIPNILGL